MRIPNIRRAEGFIGTPSKEDTNFTELSSSSPLELSKALMLNTARQKHDFVEGGDCLENVPETPNNTLNNPVGFFFLHRIPKL